MPASGISSRIALRSLSHLWPDSERSCRSDRHTARVLRCLASRGDGAYVASSSTMEITPFLSERKDRVRRTDRHRRSIGGRRWPWNSAAFPEPSKWTRHLRSRLRVVVPDNLGLVLYCSPSGELTSACVAVALRKRGISNILGSDSRHGREDLPITLQLSRSGEAAERFGIEIVESEPRITV
jgi:hypothetical protein